MSAPPCGFPVTVSVAIGEPINLAKAKMPMICPPVSGDLAKWVGLVALCWSEFETYFNDFLRLMLTSSGTTLSEYWPFWPFDSRLDRFKKQAKLLFANDPSIATFIGGVLADCIRLQLVRNTILHGIMQLKAEITAHEDATTTFKETLEFSSRKSGHLVEFGYGQSELEDLYYEIAFLGGRVRALLTPGEADGLSPQDVARLQSLRKSAAG